MKVWLVFLLLLCCVSGDQTMTKEDFPQQPSLQGLYSALKEMRGLLSELRVETSVLQRENQAQAAKLKDLEKQNADLQKLKQQQQPVQKVAFSASLLAEGQGTFGPFNVQVPLIFSNVVLNIGNAYNGSTGIFAAPHSGVYHFEWHVGSQGSGSTATSVVLMKNSVLRTFLAFEIVTGYGTSSQSISLPLVAGEAVQLYLWQNALIYDNQLHLSTFSGHLLFTL